ncbi:SRPBCC family protein [Vulcaniibacterium thermophilum]|nr:SRPBCC family protein [Vulcaniibacterium thermophilum]
MATVRRRMDKPAAARETRRMEIVCQAEQQLPCPPGQAFALITDADRFPAFFRGCGPVPAVRAVELDAPPLAVGARRTVRNADGSVLREVVTAFEPPRRHAYRLDGFRPPFAWLVRHGDACWTVEPDAAGSRVRWSYRFALAHAAAWPVAAPLLRLFMTAAMRRCLRAMADAATPIAPARLEVRP